MRKIKHYVGDACPKCHEGILETYNSDKDNKIILACDSCTEIIDSYEQE